MDSPQTLQEASRALSTATVLYHHNVAQQLGLNDTDHKCLDVLLRDGAMTAGELAARTGFTTGAITGIANRLAARKFLRRETDPADGRRVVLQPVPAAVHAAMWPLLQPMVERMSALHHSYSKSELTLILRYLRESESVLRECARALPSVPDRPTKPPKAAGRGRR